VRKNPFHCLIVLFWGAKIRSLCEGAYHATISHFPLATTTVGWVLDRTPGGPKRKWRTRSEAESCAGGLPTENSAKGELQY